MMKVAIRNTVHVLIVIVAGRKRLTSLFELGAMLLTLDRAVSKAVMRMELGAADYALAPPGCFFGMPPTLLGTMLPLLSYQAFATEREKLTWLCCCMLGALYSLSALASDMRAGLMLSGTLSQQKYYTLVLFVQLAASPAKARMVVLISLMLFTQAVNQVIKKIVGRPRPNIELIGRRSVDVRRWSVNEGPDKGAMPQDAE
jgi:hypothetical protein